MVRVIEKFNYEIPELKCDFEISLIINYQNEIKRKLNEIIDCINNQEQIRTEVAIQDIKKDIERAKIEAINNSQMAMLNGRV